MNRYFNAAYPFGFTAGILCVVGFLLMYLLEIEPISMVLVFGYIITPVFVFIGIKQFRDKFNGGELFFGQGMTVGFFVYTLMAVISATFIGVFIAFEPEVFETFKSMNINLLNEKRDILVEQLNQQAFDETYVNIQQMTTWDVIMNDFLRKVIPGLFFTILISIILKRTLNT
ncbi:DUF4199 domain-containing protein [Lunatibacter salilacus]|uniref:DUF4199 domain-containing protein n=1 Tax=Lunatibacter salilacus TaxID=2483804 RepID=UPI00131CB56B|nr:DUF4199 domain-containing protein [Lunatibacter salilacus]